MVEQIAFNYSVGSSSLPGPIKTRRFGIQDIRGLTAIGEVTHLLNVWMMNPCEFESHLVRNNIPNTISRILFLSAKEL